MLRLAITGGLASGKSTVSQMLREAGCPVVDADQIGRELLQGPVKQELVAQFGSGILDSAGAVSALRLADLAFAPGADDALHALNHILHPPIMGAAARQLQVWERQGVRLAGLEAALLIECGLLDGFDRVLLVVCEAGDRLRRYCARTGATPKQARARMARQWSDAEKARVAHFVIDNNGTRAATRQQVVAIMGQLQQEASA